MAFPLAIFLQLIKAVKQLVMSRWLPTGDDKLYYNQLIYELNYIIYPFTFENMHNSSSVNAIGQIGRTTLLTTTTN